MRTLEQRLFWRRRTGYKGLHGRVTLFFLRYFGIFKKKNILKQVGHRKRYLPYNRCYFLHSPSTTCMHQGFKALKSKLWVEQKDCWNSSGHVEAHLEITAVRTQEMKMQPSTQAAGKLGLGHFAFTSVVLTLCTPEIIFKVGGAQRRRKSFVSCFWKLKIHK